MPTPLVRFAIMGGGGVGGYFGARLARHGFDKTIGDESGLNATHHTSSEWPESSISVEVEKFQNVRRFASRDCYYPGSD
jgi:ketopantoate reductase